jgi:hypothetical protein
VYLNYNCHCISGITANYLTVASRVQIASKLTAAESAAQIAVIGVQDGPTKVAAYNSAKTAYESTSQIFGSEATVATMAARTAAQETVKTMTKVMSGIAIGLGIVTIGLDIFSIIEAAKQNNKVEITIRIVIEELKKKQEIKCD